MWEWQPVRLPIIAAYAARAYIARAHAARGLTLLGLMLFGLMLLGLRGSIVFIRSQRAALTTICRAVCSEQLCRFCHSNETNLPTNFP